MRSNNSSSRNINKNNSIGRSPVGVEAPKANFYLDVTTVGKKKITSHSIESKCSIELSSLKKPSPPSGQGPAVTATPKLNMRLSCPVRS